MRVIKTTPVYPTGVIVVSNKPFTHIMSVAEVFVYLSLGHAA